MPNIQLSAVLDIRPEHVAEFERRLDELVIAAASEPGVLEYRIWRDRTIPTRFLAPSATPISSRSTRT